MGEPRRLLRKQKVIVASGRDPFGVAFAGQSNMQMGKAGSFITPAQAVAVQ